MEMMDVLIPSNWGDMVVVFQSEPIYIRSDGSIEGTDRISSIDNVTYAFTSDINGSIVVQRSDIVIDGDGYTLGMDYLGAINGFNLTSVSNVTVKNVNIVGFGYAVWLEYASENVISSSNATLNEGGVWLVSSLGNVVSGNEITGSVEAVALDSSSSGNTISDNILVESHYGVYVRNSSGNLISGNNITNNDDGIWLYKSSDNTISGNNITANGVVGVTLEDSSNNTIAGNNMRANIDYGVALYGSSNNNTISGNTITDSDYGLWLESSFNMIWGNDISNNKAFLGSEGLYIGFSVKNNVISGNNIANNYYGIDLYDDTSNNTICGNNIADNEWHGLYQHGSSDNFIYNNNFVNNTNHVLSSNSANIWNNDVEGNYWSNYTGFDSNHDGIGDTNHTIDTNNIDNYPLMGPFNSFNTSMGKPINVISNSTVEGFEFESPSTIRFSVSNMTRNQTIGFCRVTISHGLLSPPYNVTVNGVSPTLVNFTIYDNGTHRWIYFEYEHSTWEIVIIPEFSPMLFLSLFIVLTLLAATTYRKRQLLTK
jgi:parallel beta-helix repeat protein